MTSPLKAFSDFCSFLSAVIFRLSNLFVGGVFGLLWVCYTQITAQPLPMSWFWGSLGLFFVLATFGAWREQFLQVETHRFQRPDFQYTPDGSEIVPTYDASMVRVKMSLRFTNRGEAAAYDLNSAIYGCWINDDPPSVFVDRGRSVGKTNPGERVHRRFGVWHPMEETDRKSGNGDALTLVFLYEVKGHVGSRDGKLFENEPIWLMWHPGLNNIMSWARPEDVTEAAPHIQRFKEEQEHHASVTLPS
jgi:hypothetical protein